MSQGLNFILALSALWLVAASQHRDHGITPSGTY